METDNTIIKVKEPMQQGDSLLIRFKYKEGGMPTDIPREQDLIACLYDRKRGIVQSARLSDGTLRSIGDHAYEMSVTHESTARLVGKAFLELTIATEDLSFVDHAKQVVELYFETRANNEILEETV